MNKGTHLQLCAVNSLKDFLKFERLKDEEAEAELERLRAQQMKVLKMFMNENIRTMNAVMRMLKQHKEDCEQEDILRAEKQRGICKRILSGTVRLMAAGFNTLKDYANKDFKIKQRTIMRMLDVNYRNMAGAWRVFMHFWNMCQMADKETDNLKRNVVYRMMDKAHNLCAAAFKRLVKYNDQLKQYQRGIALRMIDQNYRLMGQAFNVLQAHCQQIYNMQKSFAMKMLDSQKRLMGQAMRSLREFNTLYGDWQGKPFIVKTYRETEEKDGRNRNENDEHRFQTYGRLSYVPESIEQLHERKGRERLQHETRFH